MIKSDNLEIDEHGIYILRNNIKKEHIDFYQIHKVEIKREFRLRYWYISLLSGVFVLIVAVYWLSNFISDISYNAIRFSGDIRAPWLLFISLLIVAAMGIMIVKSSIEKTMILYLYLNKRFKRVSLLYLEKKGLVNELKIFLNKRIKTRVDSI